MTEPVRIPADIDLPDRVLGPFTARQLAVLGVTASVLYLAGNTVHTLAPALPVAAILAACAPVLGVVGLLVCGQRDGLSLDRLLWAALRHYATGTRHLTAPEGVGTPPAWLAATSTAADATTASSTVSAAASVTGWQPPARSVASYGQGRVGFAAPVAAAGAGRRALTGDSLGSVGVVDLGSDGLCVIASASTVNFVLRTPAEQEALVAGFGRWLHSLTAPVQILVRAERIDLTAQVRDLHARAAGLPDRGLSTLAHDHAEFLAHLHADADLLRHQVLLVFRDPTATNTAPGTTGDTAAHDTARSDVAGLTELTDPDSDTETPAGSRRPRRQGQPRGRLRGRRGTRAAASAAAVRAAHDRLARRVSEAADLLAPIGITVTGLDAARAGAVLIAALNPGLPIAPSAATALPGEVITALPAFSPCPRPAPVTARPWTGLGADHADGADGADDDAIEAANFAASPSPGRGRRSPR